MESFFSQHFLQRPIPGRKDDLVHRFDALTGSRSGLRVLWPLMACQCTWFHHNLFLLCAARMLGTSDMILRLLFVHQSLQEACRSLGGALSQAKAAAAPRLQPKGQWWVGCRGAKGKYDEGGKLHRCISAAGLINVLRHEDHTLPFQYALVHHTPKFPSLREKAKGDRTAEGKRSG